MRGFLLTLPFIVIFIFGWLANGLLIVSLTFILVFILAGFIAVGLIYMDGDGDS